MGTPNPNQVGTPNPNPNQVGPEARGRATERQHEHNAPTAGWLTPYPYPYPYP